MADKRKRDHCAWPNCPELAVRDSRYCHAHSHVAVLQRRIQELEGTRGASLAGLLDRFAPLQELLELVATLADRAEPLTAAQIQVTPRSSAHNLGDGIVNLGDHIVRPGYSVTSKPDEGRLGAAIAAVVRCVSDVKRAADPDPQHKRRDDRPRCGRKDCDHRWLRQPVGIRFCAYCGRDMTVKEAESA